MGKADKAVELYELREGERLSLRGGRRVLRGEICGAWSRQYQRPCRGIPLPPSGRCRMHGAFAGPKTPEGKRRALMNLRQYRDKAKE
jgi:hypothetical protein